MILTVWCNILGLEVRAYCRVVVLSLAVTSIVEGEEHVNLSAR